MKKRVAGNRGLIKMIIIIVVALLILSYFGINLRQIINAPTTQDNFSYVWNATVNIWNDYLKVPATYLWGIFVDYAWKPALKLIINAQLNNSQPTNIGSSTPYLQ